MSPPCWGGRLGRRELPSAALPFRPAWGSGCPSVRPRPSHEHSGALCCVLPLQGGCRGLVPVGDARVHPDPTVCSLWLRCHQHGMLMATVGSLSRCHMLSVCWRKVCKPLRAQAGPRCLPAACASLRAPAHVCLVQGSTSPPGSRRPTCLPHETSLQQDAEKCL